MTEHYSQFGEAAGAAMAHNARMAARHAVERAAEEQTAEAPRDGLSAPLSAPHSPDDTQDPDGRDNASGGRTADPGRAELCRQFKAAITRRWDVGPFVIDEIVDDAVDCHLSRVREYENAIKEQRDALVAQITAVRDVADAIDTEMRTEPDTQRSAMQMETVTRIRAALDAPQAGDDTTGATP